jgi:hypothetical protein
VVAGLLRSVAPTGGYWPRDRARPPGPVKATTPGLIARPGVVAHSELAAVPDVPAKAAASLVVSTGCDWLGVARNLGTILGVVLVVRCLILAAIASK